MNEYLLLIILFVVLLAIELLYFKVAIRCNIVDHPNNRSSHTKDTILGGGIIFYVAAVAFFCYSHFKFPWFMLGLTIIAVASYWDDVKPLPLKVKLPVHFVAIALMLFQYGVFDSRWAYALIALVGCVGVINAFNFMDGVNGMTGMYSLITLCTLGYINLYRFQFIEPHLIYFPIIAIVVFAFFNFRTNAKCFCGDVGSLSIAYIILFLLGILIMKSRDISYIMLLAIYGADTALTIYHRLTLRENITVAHRKHIYQIMANELHIPHLAVSGIYAALQLAINIALFLLFSERYLYMSVVVAALCVVYYLFIIKYYKLVKA